MIGLMVGGALIEYVAHSHCSTVCVEERLVESEDGRVDLVDLCFMPAANAFIDPLSISFFCSDASVSIFTDQAIGEAHSQRGPPKSFA